MSLRVVVEFELCVSISIGKIKANRAERAASKLKRVKGLKRVMIL